VSERPSGPRALLSVSDKAGIEDFARRLVELGFELLSTGGTCRVLEAAGLPVTEVSSHTGFPEIMDGRVKTLHPRIHGGILGRRDRDAGVMAEHGIDPIDVVAVNLYPFEAATAAPDCTLETAIENIDIGGPAMVRAAAKNHRDVLVVVDPEDYAEVADALAARTNDPALRRRLAVKAFGHTARYDALVARYLDGSGNFPDTLALGWRKAMDLRYGENPHQRAALYRDPGDTSGSLAGAEQFQGKALSYNNLADADAALACARAFDDTVCVIVKHANPCGVALGVDTLEAYDRAYGTDPTSAFGGILAFNRLLAGATLEAILDRQFAEVIIAPGFDDDALRVAAGKPRLRLLRIGDRATAPPAGLDLKRIDGGLLVQSVDDREVDDAALRVVSRRAPTPRERADLLFAWRVAWFVKSNAIVYAADGRTIGVGAGQMSRVVSARIAALKAADEGLTVSGSVMASDAFFPFRDGIDAAAEAGVTAVIQPGGSMRDEEVIAAADEHGMAMLFTGMRHFRH